MEGIVNVVLLRSTFAPLNQSYFCHYPDFCPGVKRLVYAKERFVIYPRLGYLWIKMGLEKLSFIFSKLWFVFNKDV